MSEENPQGPFGFTEPESAANTANPPVYPYNNVQRTNSGHYLEMDDTPSRERVRLQHRTGTFTEMHPDGTQVNHIVGDSYHIVEKNGYIKIQGVCSIVVEGDAQVDFQGNVFQRVKGDWQVDVQGNFDLKVTGETNILSGGNLKLKTGSLLSSIRFSSASSMKLDTDLNVSGEVRADSLYSSGAVVAGTGIHAGIPGSLNPFAGISTLGGIAQGTTVAPPNGITAIGPVFAPTFFGVEVFDRAGPMSAMRAIYNSHIHPTPRGPSGPPISPMPI
jgi:hypothetical protein